ncbi:MAG: NAD(P)/FAD-dependent oxidoreductase [Chlamydiae bacterium]|nr:NAD(P)/FAD-dependent oxidoreductase [Chlamydiota bacterium]MBI3266571.1 NAD(P)/FAD-dependent oxidoreductase [Chlamydiota bacterium]
MAPEQEIKMIWDVAIIGAGAAGLMTAITCGEAGLKVLLLDGREKIGAKILMSGGTRCNITNRDVSERDFGSEQNRVVRDVLRSFTSEASLRFFEQWGVHVLMEEGGKYFPDTHSAKTVLDGLIQGCSKKGVQLKTNQKVSEIQFRENHFKAYALGSSILDSSSVVARFIGQSMHGPINGATTNVHMPNLFLISGKGFSYEAKTVVLCTGGLSYPTTGSDGVGYEIAKSFGHSLVLTTPALTPLLTNDSAWKALMGVSLPVKLTLSLHDQKKASFEGSFLFTHFGFSGTPVLNISRHWVREPDKNALKMMANFLPSESQEGFRQSFVLAAQKSSSKTLKNFLSEKLPERFVETFLKKNKLAENLVLNQLKREARESLIQSLFYYSLPVTGVYGYQKAEVTAGGVDLLEVDPKTLESKLQPGLFFAGEILDVDGRIGGFNFQWAWSSGVVAGRGVVKKML